ELPFGLGITPGPKSPLGVLHDVALVHQGYAFALVGQGILKCRPKQPFAALARNRLDADAAAFGETDLAIFLGERFLEESQEFLARFGALLEFDASVNIF